MAKTTESGAQPPGQGWLWPKTAPECAKQRDGTRRSLKIVVNVKTD